MAKKAKGRRKPAKKESFEYVRAVKNSAGYLRFEYKLHGNIAARIGHDEDAINFSKEDIINCAASVLSVPYDERHKIEVIEE